MNDQPLTRLTADTAADVCGRFAIGDAARGRLREGMAPGAFLDELIEAQEFPDAVRFLAHALPKREAVWWACRCARQVAGSSPAAPIEATLRAAEAWVSDPSEENRRAALPAAEEAKLGTPAGCAAVSAFWSGGSLGPPHVPVIPPGEHLTAHGVAGAVMLAAVATEPEQAPDKYRNFLALGLGIARGEHPWPEVKSPAPRPEPPTAPQAGPSAPLTRSKIRWE